MSATQNPTATTVTAGDRVAWDSPMFGRREATVLRTRQATVPEHDGEKLTWAATGSLEVLLCWDEDDRHEWTDLRQASWRWA